MYKISVPIMNRNMNRVEKEKVLRQLRELDAKRVFIALQVKGSDPEKDKREIETLKNNCLFLKEHGIEEVGAWFWTFLEKGQNDFMHMKTLEGKVLEEDCCPLDEKFCEAKGTYLQELAKTGVDILLFDDDFRYGYRARSMNCICDLHMQKINEILGEDATSELVAHYVLSGDKNKYRAAWMQVNGDSLKEFARRMRTYVNEVNPSIRIGLCSCMSVWDTDGVDSVTLSKILAGNTKPFLRLIGAPYWASKRSWGNRLQDVIELTRMERSWCDDGIEIIGEGDTYPRPRHKCPASYLEIFDTALRADGGVDGILKYAVDYVSSPDYENGYIVHHKRNKPIYDEISKAFSDKKACGVRVYEAMNKFQNASIPKEAEGTSQVQDLFFSISARMLAENTIPTIYEGDGVAGIAFGENIKYVPEDALKKGIVIDLAAAEILEKQGYDTGILDIGEKFTPEEEVFPNQANEYALTNFNAYKISVKDEAEIDSYYIYEETKLPAAYYYMNKQGHRFFVFAFYAYFNDETAWRSYARSLQVRTAVEKLSGKKLPAYSYGNPDLYLMTKKDEKSMAVGLWNVFADCVFELVVELDKAYKEIRFINCTGRIDGNKVYLSELPAFSFAGFEVTD